MITSTKRFNIMCVTIKMNERKKKGAQGVPPFSSFLQSNMMRFQSSPVLIENNSWKL